MAFAHPEPIPLAAIAQWLRALPAEANSGDVYVSIEPLRLAANQAPWG